MKKLFILVILVISMWYIYQYYFKQSDISILPKTTIEIKDLISNSYKYDGETVKILGFSSDSYNLGFIKFYRVKDARGDFIWVKSDYVCPDDGSFVSVTGKFKQLYKVGAMEMPVIFATGKAKIINHN